MAAAKAGKFLLLSASANSINSTCLRRILVQPRCLTRLSQRGVRTETETTSDVKNYDSHEKSLLDIENLNERKERFIPVTRHTLMRHIVENNQFLTDDEKSIFEDFTIALDHALHTRFYGVLEELKVLFDPINPDKETSPLRPLTKKEQLDSEFWLMQRLGDVLHRANFNELPKEAVKAALEEHNSQSKVTVSVDVDKYDILRFWTLGREAPPVSESWYKTWFDRARGIVPQPTAELYKRVVIASRWKRDKKLTLKSFKDIPIGSLEMLLPDGQIAMRAMDRGALTTSACLAVAGLVAKLVTYLAGYHIDWTLLVTVVTGAVAAQAWSAYKDRLAAYMLERSRMLYFKNIANNRGLLTLLVDRAQDECFKEALLAYIFLLTNRPSYSRLQSSTADSLPSSFGSLSELRLDKKIKEWVKEAYSVDVAFECIDSIDILQHFGILKKADNKLSVLPLHVAIKNLPQLAHPLVPRTVDNDLIEGYDKDSQNIESESEKDEKKLHFSGWF